MVDFIDEVNADLRQERFNRFWQKIGAYVVAASVVIVVATVGTVLWQNHRTNRQSAAAEAFLAADKELKAQRYNEAASAFAKVSEQNAQGFTELAKMREAYAWTKAGKDNEALAAYRKIAEQGGVDKGVQSLARIYAAILMMEMDRPAEEITSILQPLAEKKDNPFSAFAREHMAYVALKNGDAATAHSILTELSTDMQAPASLRRRTQAQLATVGEAMEEGTNQVTKPAE